MHHAGHKRREGVCQKKLQCLHPPEQQVNTLWAPHAAAPTNWTTCWSRDVLQTRQSGEANTSAGSHRTHTRGAGPAHQAHGRKTRHRARQTPPLCHGGSTLGGAREEGRGKQDQLLWGTVLRKVVAQCIAHSTKGQQQHTFICPHHQFWGGHARRSRMRAHNSTVFSKSSTSRAQHTQPLVSTSQTPSTHRFQGTDRQTGQEEVARACGMAGPNVHPSSPSWLTVEKGTPPPVLVPRRAARRPARSVLVCARTPASAQN